MTTTPENLFDDEPQVTEQGVDALGTMQIDVDPAPVAPQPPLLTRIRLRVRHWRRSRPFWGALVLCIGAYFIFKPVIGGSITLLVKQGAAGMASYLIGAGMLAAAITGVLAPAQRHFPAIVATILSVVSLPLANLGGWFVGLFFGILGSAMMFAWTPYSEKDLAKAAAKDARKAARRAAKVAQTASTA